jgi:hypothetical protein
MASDIARIRMHNAIAVIALIVALLAALGAPLQPPTELQTGASRVALAAVTDPRNRPLVDVGADDFVIQESGVAREVLSVRPADYPIVIMIDTGGAARGDFALIRKAVAEFIGRVGQRPMVVGTYGNEPKMLTTFDDERQTMMERLDEVQAEVGADSVLRQAAALAGQTIRPTGALFSAIVIVSATPDDASRGQTDELVSPVIDSGAALHVVANVPAQPAGDARPGPSLRALAQQTHGEYTAIYSAASYQAALDRLADRMNAEMMIEYLVPVGSKPNDVKVGTRVVGARVRGLGVAPR